MLYRYATGNKFSAMLKRQAHAVRQTVDALPREMQGADGKAYNPRLRRLVQIPGPDKHDKPVMCQPRLSPRERHVVAHVNYVKGGFW